MISKKKSKSFDQNTKNVIFSKIKSQHKCKSLLNLKSNISINKKINKEVIEYKLVPSLNNDKTNILKSFQNYIKNQKLNLSKDEEFNQCLTTSSKYDINSKNKNNGINREEESENNKEYIIVPKTNSKIRNSKKHNSSKMINKRYILKIENNIDNIFKENSDMKFNISNLNNNTTYNNYKTYRNNNADIDNENITQKFSFDDISIVSKINSIEGNENINIIEEDDDFLKVCQNDNKENKNYINKYKIIINKLNKEKIELSENLNKICLTNNELKNYNEILKQTIENYIIKSDVKDIIYETSKILNKSPVNLLTEFTKYKIENKKIKKNLLLQQILTNEMKNEIENLRKENENLVKNNQKLNSEKKAHIDDNKTNTLNSSNMKNEECYKTLIETNTDLNKKYLDLKNDFGVLFQNNENLIKYKEKLIKENEQLKIEINNLKKNEIIKKQFDELKNKNMELKMINDRQKNEMENIKEILNIKKNELIKFKKEMQIYKEKEYQNMNELIKKKDSEISELKTQINNAEQMINEIYSKIQIKKYMDLSDEIICIDNKGNLEDKMTKIRNYIDILIKEINNFKQKEDNFYKNVLEDNSMNINYNNNNKEEDDLIILDEEYHHVKYDDNSKLDYNKKNRNGENENTYNYNYKKALDNIQEELSIIKKEENQISIFNNDKKDDLIDFKYKNNKILPNPIKPKRNNIIFKSFSTKQIKSNNNYIDIFRNKNKIIKTRSDNNNKIEINTKDIKSLLINDKEETKNDYIDSRYITVPVKREKGFSSIKAKKLKTRIGISNNSNYLNELIVKNPKYIQGLQTIESSTRILNNNFCSINNDHSFNLNEKIKEIKDNKRQNFRLYASKSIKNIQSSAKFNLTEKSKSNLANEVLKPSFLKSGFNSTFYNYYNNNQNSNKNNNNKVIRENIYKKINFL